METKGEVRMKSKHVVRVSDASAKVLRAHAERQGVSVGEAADACIALAGRRHASLKRHAAKLRTSTKKAKK